MKLSKFQKTRLKLTLFMCAAATMLPDGFQKMIFPLFPHRRNRIYLVTKIIHACQIAKFICIFPPAMRSGPQRIRPLLAPHGPNKQPPIPRRAGKPPCRNHRMPGLLKRFNNTCRPVFIIGAKIFSDEIAKIKYFALHNTKMCIIFAV